jgi:raffinose/stachyose/melibiose transport system substrate-binding protein
MSVHTSSPPSRRGLLRGSATIVALLALAACSSPGGSQGVSASEAKVTSVSTAVPKGDVTLKLYDGQGLSKVDDALSAAFTKKYPNIKIDPTYDPDDVTTQNQPRQLASASPPDLIRVISVTSGVKNNLLTNLDAYAKAYGWDKLPPSQLAQFRADKGVAGSGSLYAKASGFTMTGLYYNKALAKQIGMTAAPTSVAGLEALMAKAKTDGLTPMVVGNKQGGAVFPYQLLLNSSMGPDKVAAWVFNAPDATIDTPESVAAAQKVLDWNDRGYLPKGINGLDATGADGLFAGGKAVFYPWGNWAATNMDTTMAGNVGFMPMPPVTDGGQVAAMSDAATSFGIPVKSKNKDAAALFLNFLSSDEARQIAVDNGFMPTGADSQAAPQVKAGSVLTDVVAGFSAVSAGNGQVPFVQNATAGISNQGWNPESQLLMGGKGSAADFVKNIQTKYEEELSR